MSRPTRRQIYQPQPQYASVAQQSPPRGSSISYSQQQQQQQPPQGPWGQPVPQPQPQPQFQTNRVPVPQPQIGGPRPVRSSSANSQNRRQQQHGRQVTAMGVATGNIGAGYGPYSYHPEQAKETGVYGTNTRFSTAPSSDNSLATAPPTREKVAPPPSAPRVPTTTTIPTYMWDRDPDIDDHLHNPDPRGDSSFTCFSLRGWVNATMIFVIIVGLFALFIGYPALYHFTHLPSKFAGFNIGGINSTGQIPILQGVPKLIDVTTPTDVYTRTGSDGKVYDLVFSDEFSVDGRSFYPGDDPFWEAADLHYWPTGNAEWYDPSAVTTKDGKLVITITEELIHDLNFKSGMITSWNKICFTTGYIEVSVSLPGSPDAAGLWPGAWTLGNLGRAGYGATTQGMWPYSYDSCDVGTFPGQVDVNGQPANVATAGPNGGPMSLQPGQKLSACTCPGSDHPGPSVSKGRGVPEIDIIEARIDNVKLQGMVSQSFQCAPYDYKFNWNEDSPATTVYNESISFINTYKGGQYQQAVSVESYVEDQFYNDKAYAPYGFEYWSDPQHRDSSYITWYSNNEKTWTMTSATVGPDNDSGIGQRLISEEPMYMILNLGMADSFQKPDFKHLVFPSSMYVDYVRVYQRRGTKNGLTCNPPSHPTTDYINKHLNAYTNPNLTLWQDAGYSFPRNSKYSGCT